MPWTLEHGVALARALHRLGELNDATEDYLYCQPYQVCQQVACDPCYNFKGKSAVHLQMLTS